MRLSRTFSPLLLLLTACASVPPARPAPATPLASAMLTETEIDLLADLLRREDNRQYDSAAFQGFLSSPNETLRLLEEPAWDGRVAALSR